MLVEVDPISVDADGRTTSNAPSNLVIESEMVSRRSENSFAFSAKDLRRPSLILLLLSVGSHVHTLRFSCLSF